MLKLVNTRGSRKKKIERYWPNALSFCEVKATSSEDCKDFTATQCLRYTVSQNPSRLRIGIDHRN